MGYFKYFAVPVEGGYHRIKKGVTVQWDDDISDKLYEMVNRRYPGAVELTDEQLEELRKIIRADVALYEKIFKDKDMAKNTKKINTKNLDFIIDVENMTCANDFYYAVALAKIEKYFTYNELKALMEHVRPEFTVCFCDKCPFCQEEKKPNIFKRFWNWITRKK